VVVIPIYRSDEERGSVLETAAKVRDGLVGNGVRVKIDDRDQHRPGYKFAEWELKGVPVRIEIGPKDVAAGQVVMVDRMTREKKATPIADAISSMTEVLANVQKSLHSDALAFREANTHQIESYDSFREGVEAQSGFWVGAWCGSEDCERKVSADTSASIRVLPLEREDPGAACCVCGRPGTEIATWAKAY
jgi:prolyl-tRNA synthetase